MAITYNTLETIKITVVFENPTQYNEWLTWKKKEDVIPCTAGELRFVKYEWQSAHYDKANAMKIEVWLRKQKAKLNTKIHL